MNVRELKKAIEELPGDMQLIIRINDSYHVEFRRIEEILPPLSKKDHGLITTRLIARESLCLKCSNYFIRGLEILLPQWCNSCMESEIEKENAQK